MCKIASKKPQTKCVSKKASISEQEENNQILGTTPVCLVHTTQAHKTAVMQLHLISQLSS